MILDVVGPLLALAKASIDASKAAVRHEAQVCRIAGRLTWLIARTNQWASICGSPSDDTYQRFKLVLERIYICMHHASKEKSEKWIALTDPLNPFQKDRLKLIQELEDAEQQLTTLISDVHLEQMNMQMLQMLRMEKKFETTIVSALNRFGSIKLVKTIQQEADEMLDMCHQQVAVVSSVDRDFLTDHRKDTNEGGFENDSLIIKKEQLHFDPKDETKYLGGGGFAEVYLGKYKGHDVAVKRLKLDPKVVARMDSQELKADSERIKSEALLTFKVTSHSNIVNIYGYHTDINLIERPLIVMELMHTTLFEAIHYRKEKPLSFSQIFDLMEGIAQAIEFLHLQGIIHHDIKSSNILLDSTLSKAKLSDFGEAKVKGIETTRLVLSEMLSTRGGGNHAVAGTVAYIAPEVLLEKVTESSRSSEMYSFGVTLWECLTGEIPHLGKKESSITNLAHKVGEPMLIIPSFPSLDLSDEDKQAWTAIKDITSRCVSRDFKSRPTASGVVRTWSESKIMETFIPSANLTLSNDSPISRQARLPSNGDVKPETHDVVPKEESDNLCQESQSELPSPLLPETSIQLDSPSLSHDSSRKSTISTISISQSTNNGIMNMNQNSETLNNEEDEVDEAQSARIICTGLCEQDLIAFILPIAVVVAVVVPLILLGSTKEPISSPTQSPTTIPTTSPTSREEFILDLFLDVEPSLNVSQVTDLDALQWISQDSYTEEKLHQENSIRHLLERYVLATLYFATNGDSWDRGYSFLNPISHCEWNDGSSQGVFCYGDGFVDIIDISENSLSGTIPPEMGLLTGLNGLGFASNRLTGSIPTELASLPNIIWFNLDGNALNGTIPTEFGKISNLEYLRLASNQLTGKVPAEFFTISSLGHLHIDNNKLTGDIDSLFCTGGPSLDEPVRIDCDELRCTCCDDGSSNPCFP